MQIKNNYEKEVFNGDIGIVASVDAENRVLKVNFDNRMVENVTVEKRNTLLKERLME